MNIKIVTILLVALAQADTNHEDDLNRNFFYKPGDARICIDVARNTGFNMHRFSALPGIGWDNLRNTAGGLVIDFKYHECKTTDDGRYLIPDAVFTIPIKRSLVRPFAELYESWNNVTSTTAKSINVNAGLKFDFVSISGSYSEENIRMKKTIIKDDTVAARIQVRYPRYKARLQPGSVLYPMFKARLLDIAEDLDMNLTESAFYKAELLVRDYGTHVQTSVTAGAKLVKTDYLRRIYVASHSSDKRVITASAGGSFASIFKFDASFRQTTNVNVDEGYKRSVMSSNIESNGGGKLRPYNMTIDEWAKSVDNDMVAIDRTGDPLYFLISTATLPELPGPMIDQIEKNVRDAVEEYYEMNTRFGCTKRGSPNFSYAANVDDGSCIDIKLILTFGGVFQTCGVTGTYRHHNPCSGMSTVNILTKDHSCPAGYQSIKISSGVKSGVAESTRSCRRCGFLRLKKCCKTTHYYANGHYDSYWCAATDAAKERSGYLFGGIFSPSTTNLVTGTKACPPLFLAIPFLQSFKVCISDDYEFAEHSAVPFGGFHSCSKGNPLSISKSVQPEVIAKDSQTWPKHCPQGYSQHLAAIDQGCAIHYCIKTGALTLSPVPPILRPPFSPRPDSRVEKDVYVIVNKNSSAPGVGRKVSEDVYNNALKASQSGQTDESIGTLGLNLPDNKCHLSLPSGPITAIFITIVMFTIHYGV